MDMIKRAGIIANDIVDGVSWLVNRMHSPGREFDRSQLLGATAEVSTAIKRGQIGEVIVPLGRTLQNYSARALQADRDFCKGSKVRIAEVGTNLVFIEEFPSQNNAQSPFTVMGEVEDYCE